MAQSSSTGKRVQLKRENGKVWLEGFDPFLPYQEATPINCLATAMRAMGEDVSYEWLMGVSGQAFRFQLSKGFAPQADGWCGSSPHANCGYNTAKFARAALPYETIDYPCFQKSEEEVAKARAAVVASIDAGVPAIGGSEEDHLVVGYAEDGKVLLIRAPLGDRNALYKESRNTPWGFAVLKPKGNRPDRQALHRESLKRAVEIATLTSTGEAPGKPMSGYDAGIPAMRRWAGELRDDAMWDKLDQKSVMRVCTFNAWAYHGLCDARGCAQAYLAGIAPQFAEPQWSRIAKAAELYKQVAAALAEVCPTQSAPFPDMLKPGQKWDNALRHQQAKQLENAAAIEEKAIEALKLAAQ